MTAPSPSDDAWIGLTQQAIRTADIESWLVLPNCGATVTFQGVTRNYAEGRTGVTELVYEAYEGQVEPAFGRIAAAARTLWPSLGRFALVHRVGPVPLGEASVVVGVSAPHRTEAFDVARFGIDALKQTVPIWKKERWATGEDWSDATSSLVDLDQFVASFGAKR